MIHALRLIVCMVMLAISMEKPSKSVAADGVPPKALPPIPLTLNEVLAWVDRSHPLLQGTGTEKIVARGKFLKALGAFEPVLVNDTQVERFVPSGSMDTSDRRV